MLKELRRNKTIAGVLAMFAGTIGLHCFFMGKYKKGLLYLLFFWTGIPTILGIMDGARLFTQVAEEDGFGKEAMNSEESSNIEKDEEMDSIDEDTDEEIEPDEDIEDEEIDEDFDDDESEEESEEDSETDEKIKNFRDRKNRRNK
jgi:TM2 domain-containing membrane protein YozV